MNVRFVLLFILILVASVLVSAAPAFSSVTELPVPEFTVTFEDNSYYVPPTYGINEYTGENVTKRAGYYEEDKSIIIKIKNPEVDSSFNDTYSFQYSVRAKGKFGESWDYAIVSRDDRPRIELSSLSNSDYTVYSIPANHYPSGAQIDFQVAASITHNEPYWYEYDLSYLQGFWFGPFGHYEDNWITDAESDWSETQTLTISDSDSTTNSETPQQTETAPAQQDSEPEPPQSDWLTLITAGALILIPIAAGLGLMIHFSRKK